MWPDRGSNELTRLVDNQFVVPLADFEFAGYPGRDRKDNTPIEWNPEFPVSATNLEKRESWQFHTRDRRYVISYRVDGRRQLLDLEGGGLLRDEVGTLSMYDAETKERVFTILMKPKGQSLRSRRAIEQSMYVDNRFVIIPVTPGREIIYVCDLDSDSSVKLK